MAQLICRKDNMKLRGVIYGMNDVIPGDEWKLVPPDNRRAMLSQRFVVEDAIEVKPVKRKRGRPRKHPSATVASKTRVA